MVKSRLKMSDLSRHIGWLVCSLLLIATAVRAELPLSIAPADLGPFNLSLGKLPVNKGALDRIRFDNPTSIIYMNSCRSAHYFTSKIEANRARLKKEGKGLSLIARQQDGYAEHSSAENKRLIMALMEGRCPEDIAAILDSRKTYSTKEGHSVNGM